MTGLLLKKFSNKVSEQILNVIFKNLTTFSFNSNTDVSNTTYFITTTNSGNSAVFNNDIIRYYTNALGTSLGLLTNGHFYKITSANSTGFKLANVTSNATIALQSGISETHYITTYNPSYYLALSKHTPWVDENTPETPYDNLKSVRDFQREMILGKRIDRTDIAYMVRKINWQSGEVYAQYDDTAEQLFSSDFYVLTTDNNVYKCLDNANGAESTVKPTGQLTTKFQTADGYVWKYMYTLSNANNVKFSTSEYIPVDVNTSISSAAVNGAIEIIQISNTGSGYLGFTDGFIQQVISNTIFKIETVSSAISDYYNTSGFYINSGTGSGQLSIVQDYIVNTSGHFIVTANNLDSPALDTTSEYIISPQVKVYGDGSGLKAYSNVSVTGNTYSISSINIINRGQNYSYCTVNILAPHGSGASVRAVLSPESGHGYNQPAELGSSYVCISKDFANNESTAVLTQPKFRKAGIIYSPKIYANDSVYFSNTIFNALFKMAVTFNNPSEIFSEGETFIGQTSGAAAISAWSNSSFVLFSYKYGTFQNYETIIGQTSGYTGAIASINTPDINKFTNEVVYYDYVLPIQRSNTATENVKLLIAI